MIKSFISASLRKKNMPEGTGSYINVGAVDQSGFHDYDENGDYHACIGKRFYSSEEDFRIDVGISSNTDSTNEDIGKNEASVQENIAKENTSKE